MECKRCGQTRPTGTAKRSYSFHFSLIATLLTYFIHPKFQEMILGNPIRKLGVKREDSAQTEMTDIYDSPGWRKFVVLHQVDNSFGYSPANIALIINTDGVSMSSKKSLWPVTAQIANLPHSERIKPEWMPFLALIPRSTDNMDINSFLRPIVDEIKEIQANGIPLAEMFSRLGIPDIGSAFLKQVQMVSDEANRTLQCERRQSADWLGNRSGGSSTNPSSISTTLLASSSSSVAPPFTPPTPASASASTSSGGRATAAASRHHPATISSSGSSAVQQEAAVATNNVINDRNIGGGGRRPSPMVQQEGDSSSEETPGTRGRQQEHHSSRCRVYPIFFTLDHPANCKVSVVPICYYVV